MEIRAWIKDNERHFSTIALIVGFIIDSLTFTSFHLDVVILIFAAYLVIAAGSLLVLHMFSSGTGGRLGAWVRQWFPALTAFALGALLSGFLVFYSFVGSVTKSWPLVILVAGIMLGNEFLKSYRSRLPFQTSLLFLATLSFAVLVVPLYVHSIGPDAFVIAGACAVAAFWLFMELLRTTHKKRFLESRRTIVQGAAAIFVVINIFYFTNIIPPIPLSIKSSGIYHSVSHTGGEYVVTYEAQPWYTLFVPETVHLYPGETIYALTSVFAPADLSTTVVHRWQRYDTASDAWITEGVISFPINGGRDNGYRGYSAKNGLASGLWRVDAETPRGQLIGRVEFNLEEGVPAQLIQKTVL